MEDQDDQQGAGKDDGEVAQHMDLFHGRIRLGRLEMRATSRVDCEPEEGE
jgi:hypothetical protein